MKKLMAILLGCVLLLTACDTQSNSTRKNARAAAGEEQAAVSTGFARLSRAQQIPSFSYSQLRQTLIDTETIQAQGTTTTSAFYLEGIGLVGWCNSIGLPVPSTYQLSASQQYVDYPGDRTRSFVQMDQGEPTGVYPGNSTATFTLCVDDQGRKYLHYWEGYVAADSGLIAYPADKQIKPSDVTYKFTEQAPK